MWWPNRKAKTNYPGVNYIHPLRQREVEELIEKVEQCPNVTAIIVFGSSTEERCTPFSDVDALFFGEPCYFEAPINDVAYDILWRANVPCGAEILKEIRRDGVLVYEL